MTMFRNILVAVDFSETSYDALRMAADFARDGSARLHVLHVVTDPWHQPLLVEVPGTPFEELRRAVLEGAKEQLAKMRQECAPETPNITLTVMMGMPAAEIVHYAAAHDVDLIVLGTHGQSPARRFFLGSVADRVLRQATGPVLTVPHRALRGQPALDAGDVAVGTQSIV